jgi:hypothetical protein
MKCQEKQNIRGRKRVKKLEGQTDRQAERLTDGHTKKADNHILEVI